MFQQLFENQHGDETLDQMSLQLSSCRAAWLCLHGGGLVSPQSQILVNNQPFI